MLRVGDARRRVVVEQRRLRPAQGGDDAGEDHGEAEPARVDHPGLPEHGKQVGAAADGLLARVHGRLEHLGDQLVLARGVHVVQARLRVLADLVHDPARHVVRDGEDRPFRRIAHRGVRPVGGAQHRRADQHRVDELAGAGGELLRRAADELGEDHAGVAARAEQRRARDGVDDLVAADLVDRAGVGETVELVEHRAQGERHVVAGVAVGDGEDVEVVDLLAARLEFDQRAPDDGPEAKETRVGHAAGARTR